MVFRRLTLLMGASLLSTGSAFAAASAEAEHSAGLPQLNTETYLSQVFWLLIIFVSLYVLCSKIFLPRIGGVIEERRNRIADDYDQAAEFKRQAESAEATYLKALADAKARAAQIAAETRSSLDAEIAEMEAETDRQLEADIHAAEQRIHATAELAAQGIRDAAKDTTKAIVAALIDETPSDDVVEAALSQLGA
ncbi:hypothetical protein [Parvularcula sp. LCG005]|uniref:F0F1 ATP synthase subunit B family protein n=1 Tax=Parvularcula sp. LCG005 TaxID=3078805 RepID=UPI002941CCD9|nr:hypothetical protein [Parvularcula sp. LCG005]WOI52839.1 hypothetical protein RUI03_11850 [Parvularcula sp. LCG005]